MKNPDCITQDGAGKISVGGKYPKMPEGWNPSDDSEDEYTPAATRDAAKKRAGDNGEGGGEELHVKKAKVTQPGTAPSIPLPLVKVTHEKDVNANSNLTFSGSRPGEA